MIPKEQAIRDIKAFDPDFFANKPDSLKRLEYRSQDFLEDLALVLRAVKENAGHVVLPHHPESLSEARKTTAAVVRIDPLGKMFEDDRFSLRFTGIRYKVSGKAGDKEITLELVEAPDPERKVVVTSWLGEGHSILASSLVKGRRVEAKYQRGEEGEYRFSRVEIDFGRISGSISHDPGDKDVLTIPSQGPATYRFNGDHRSPLQIPADGSAEAEVHPLPFQHLISVLRDDGKEAVQVKVGERYVIQEQGVGSHNKRTPYDFKVRPTVAIPEIPPTGALEIDLDPVDIDALDRIAISLLELAPEEILPT